MSTIGARIKELRKRMGLSQTKFGEMIGKRYQSVQRWETGQVKVAESSLRHIEATFGVNSDWLRNGDGDMFAPKPSNGFSQTAVGNGHVQIGGSVITGHMGQAVKMSDLDDETREVIELLVRYAPKEYIHSIRAKLLKFKELADD